MIRQEDGLLRSMIEPSATDPFLWYVFQNNACYGPFRREQVVRLVMARQVHRNALLYRSDWESWQPLIDCLDYLSYDQASRKTLEPYQTERRIAAPRVPVNGIVVVENERDEGRGRSKDISVSGIFVSTGDAKFRLGEKVALYIQVDELPKPFSTRAEVVRFSSNRIYSIGYGLRFEDLENWVIADISKLIGYRPINEFGEVYTRVHTDGTASEGPPERETVAAGSTMTLNDRIQGRGSRENRGLVGRNEDVSGDETTVDEYVASWC